ncbi:radical SAM/SPASM domain-containing protein [Desulfosporosinus sp. FKA]|uniref:radical SAM/SPASM domain-containing protein n=1 Tax=Desulfosporosinus sp. FKA TaxID=1969834 RepID=UPI000B49DA3A|nr:radical SAM/SPASM domain-containing protein [Desulfosporosinus sp. FKA]
MKAKIGTRYYAERTPLETVIPLSTPFILYLDPSSVCNLSCEFCPCGRAHQDLWSEEKRKSVAVMPFELYKKIIDDCQGFPDKIKTLRLYKEGEPLLNKNLPEMITYARDSGRFKSIDFTTNGTLLNPGLNRKLVEAGLTRINISVEALSGKGYKKISGVDLDFDKFVANIRDLYEHRGNCHIFIKTMVDNYDQEIEGQFYGIFGDICDEIALEHIANCWPGFENTSNNTNVYHGGEVKEYVVCPRIFYILTINANGSASHCIVDWNYSGIIGDAKTQSVVDIWNSPEYQNIRLMHFNGKRRDVPLCSKCWEIESAAVDNIDEFREELLKKVEGKA